MQQKTKRFQGLWQKPDFLKLWAGETVSLFGSQMTTLALPLLAAITLQATSSQMGTLMACQFAPYLLITLFAGVWIDRKQRRPILIVANLGRFVLLGLIPLLFLLGQLRMETLYVLVFFTSVLTVFFELAYQSYLPTLIDKDELVEGNSKLQVSASIAQVSGPNLAGFLVSVLSAPFVVILDACSYFIAALFLFRIQKKELPPQQLGAKRSIWKEIRFGMTVVFQNPYLRAIASEAAAYNFFSLVTSSVLVLYLTREMHLSPKLIGFIMGGASIGSLFGSMTARYFGKRYGTGPTIVGSMLVACASPLLVPLVKGSLIVVIPMYVVSFFLGGFGLVISVVQVISLRQMIIPEQELGRVNACYRFICSAATPIGAFLGGHLGDWLGLRVTLLIGAVGTILAVGWVIFSPVAKLGTSRGGTSELIMDRLSQ